MSAATTATAADAGDSFADYSCCGGSITTYKRIEAPPATVWDVMLDGPRHDEWNPFMKNATFTAKSAVGDALEVTINGQKMTPSVTVVEDQRHFELLGTLCCGCCFSGRHEYVFEAADGGRATVFRQNEQFGGCLLYGLWCCTPCILLGPTTNNFVAMNDALKARVESAGRAPS